MGRPAQGWYQACIRCGGLFWVRPWRARRRVGWCSYACRAQDYGWRKGIKGGRATVWRCLWIWWRLHWVRHYRACAGGIYHGYYKERGG